MAWGSRSGKRKSRLIKDQAAFQLVPRRGLEPPRSYPLVPETSASTNSATWAGTFLTWLRCRRRVENVNIAFIWRLCPMAAVGHHDVSFVQQRHQMHGPCRPGVHGVLCDCVQHVALAPRSPLIARCDRCVAQLRVGCAVPLHLQRANKKPLDTRSSGFSIGAQERTRTSTELPAST